MIDITVPLKTPDTDVPMPDRTNPSSLTSRLRALKPNEAVSHVVPAITDEEILAVVNNSVGVCDRLRNSVMSSVRAAELKTGNKYKVEVFNYLTPSGLPITIAIIRLKEE